MKNIILNILVVLFITAFSNELTAQKSLEFNQVKLVTTQETVPNGKVWKIENIGSPVFYYVSAGSSTTPSIKVNGNHIYIFKLRTTQNQTYYGNQSYFFPIWLPSQTTLAVGNSINFISVIEFNELTP